MGNMWDPEQVVEPELAQSLINLQFPALDPKKMKLLGVGWDNTAYLVDDAFVFRFPRRQVAVPLLQNEILFLSEIAHKLPLPVPFPEWKGVPSELFPWPFMGYRHLPGMTAGEVCLRDAERKKMAAPLGKFLSVLHSLTPPKKLSVGENSARIDSEKLIPKIQDYLEELKLDKNLYKGLLDMKEPYRKPDMKCVVHGDFYFKHLLVNEKHELTGVIDWGDMHLGDPAIDLSIAHYFLPPESHSFFREAYGFISDETWRLARLRALLHSSLFAVYGKHSNDAAIIRETSIGLKFLETPR